MFLMVGGLSLVLSYLKGEKKKKKGKSNTVKKLFTAGSITHFHKPPFLLILASRRGTH